MFNIPQPEELKALVEITAMDTIASDSLESFRAGMEAAYRAFWFGTVSPVIKCQLLGTKALEVFTRSAQAQGFLASQIEGYEPLGIPLNYSLTWNPDGSAAISVNP